MQAPLGLYTVRFVLNAMPVEIECFVNRKLAGRSIQNRQLMIVNNVWMANDNLKRFFCQKCTHNCIKTLHMSQNCSHQYCPMRMVGGMMSDKTRSLIDNHDA